MNRTCPADDPVTASPIAMPPPPPKPATSCASRSSLTTGAALLRCFVRRHCHVQFMLSASEGQIHLMLLTFQGHLMIGNLLVYLRLDHRQVLVQLRLALG